MFEACSQIRKAFCKGQVNIPGCSIHRKYIIFGTRLWAWKFCRQKDFYLFIKCDSSIIKRNIFMHFFAFFVFKDFKANIQKPQSTLVVELSVSQSYIFCSNSLNTVQCSSLCLLIQCTYLCTVNMYTVHLHNQYEAGCACY